jgi:hypothetical protein
MNDKPKRKKRGQEPAVPDIQQGERRSIAQDERLKRSIKRHPQREEPKVDSVEPEEIPPP